ncbi:MAG TPA: class I SAM-dependent methyltransferase [Bryobacteraceae bacterium]|nr:class I SAM-dependent methyltransferase [Bryobacteraceae bacterium]
MFRVVECEGCGLIRLDPCPSPDELRGYYPDEYWFAPSQDAASQLEEAYRRFVLRDHFRFVWEAVQHASGSGLLLDVGCGGGLLLRLLQERGVRVAGLETSQAAASAAWRHNGVRVICGDLDRAPFARGSCSVLTLFHVVEHLSDPVSYLTAARELLANTGRLIVQVPNASCWQFRLLGANWNGIDVPRHLVDYRERDLERLLDGCGFTVVRRKHFSLRDNPAGFASSIAPYLDPMARRVRKTRETAGAKLAKDLMYFALVVAALPFTVAEAACGAGSTIMVEARKKA